MKKILAFLLAATMLCAMFVLPSAAASDKPYHNATLNAEIVEGSAPEVDGKVGPTEYGLFPALVYSQNKDQFTIPNDDHDDYNDWDLKFYITWDEDNLYMAWVAETEVHNPLPKATFNSDGTIASEEWPDDGSQLGYMWMYSYMQFLITPGAPETGVTSYDSNFLEIGLCELADGDVGRVVWAYPKGVTSADISINDWEAEVERDDAAKTTTYEVAIPWEMSGVAVSGTDAQFGFAFAVGAQEFYTTKKGIIEWNDAILGGKAPNNAGVITLTGGDVEQTQQTDTLTDGPVPDEAKDAIQLVVDHIDKPIAGEDIALQLDPSVEINTKWAYAMLLDPVEGKENVYTLVATAQGQGEEVVFEEYEDDMIILGVHSDGQTEADAADKLGYAEKVAAMSIPVGSELTALYIDFDKAEVEYANAMFYVSKLAAGPDTDDSSTDSSVEDSSAAPSDDDESSKTDDTSDKDDESSNATSGDESTDDDDDKGGFPWIVLVIVGVVVVVAVVVVVIIVAKKKKA